VGGSLNKSVTLIKSEPQGGKKPSPPVEKQINNTKGDEVHNLRALLSKKRAAMYFIPLVKLYHKDGMKHKFSILVVGGSSHHQVKTLSSSSLIQK